MPLFGPPNIQKLVKSSDIPALIKAANYRADPAIRLQAIEVLTRDKKNTTLRTHSFAKQIAVMLADKAKNDPDPGVPPLALNGLIKMCYSAAKFSLSAEIVELVGFLIHAIQNSRDTLAAEAAAALVRLKRLNRKFPENTDLEKYLAVLLPRQISQGSLPEAAQTAVLFGESSEIATILKQFPQTTRLDMLANLFNEDPGLAARVTASIGNPEAIPLMLKYLYLKDPLIASALLALDAKEAIPELLQSLPVGGEARDHAGIIDVIGRLGDAGTVELILARISESLKDAPQMANLSIEVSLLAGLGKRDSTFLTGAFHAGQPAGEWEALLQALGRVGDVNTIPVILEQASRNPVAAFLPQLMLIFKDNRFAPFLAENLEGWEGEAREIAIRALGELSNPVVVPTLIGIINDNNDAATRAATKALERQYQSKVITETDKLLILQTVYRLNQWHTDYSTHTDEGVKRWASTSTHTDSSEHTDQGPQIKV